MMLAFRTVDVRFRLPWRQLAGQDDTPFPVLLRQVRGDVRVERFDIADHAVQKTAGLEFLAGECRDTGQRPIEDFGGAAAVSNLLRLLLGEGVVFLLQALGKHRHRRRWDMQRAQGPAKGLNRGDDFRILPVPAVVEITEGDDLDKVEEGGRLFAADLTQLTVQIPPDRRKLLSQPFLLVVAAGIEVGAVRSAGDPRESVFAAALAANEAVQCRAASFPFSLVAIEASAHLRGVPSFVPFGGSMNP